MKNRESEIIEFKKSTSELKQALISLAAMLNKNGKGTLYFGVLNNGKIVGQQIGKDTTHDISVEIKNHIKPNVIPSISIEKENNLEIIKVEVKGNNKPYNAYGRYYIRSDDEDLLMENDILEEIFTNKTIDYSEWEKTSSSYGIDSVDENLLIEYFNKSNDIRRINYTYKDVESSLSKLGLLNGKKLNNAGYYLFSKSKPLKLKLATFNSDARISFSDIKLFEGNIFECINEGISYITEKMNWYAKIVGAKRIEIPEIPLEAIREIVVNSFAHMKVSSAILNEIYLTPTKIVIKNPGSIYKNIKPEQFATGEQGAILRNPLIDMVLYKNGTIDSFATGFQRTFELCKKNKISYKYLSNEDSFTFIFIREKKTKIDDTINDTKENRSDSIIQILKSSPSSSRRKIAKKLDVSEATVARNLKILQKLKLIKRKGSNKFGHWVVL